MFYADLDVFLHLDPLALNFYYIFTENTVNTVYRKVLLLVDAHAKNAYLPEWANSQSF